MAQWAPLGDADGEATKARQQLWGQRARSGQRSGAQLELGLARG
jgi:hypothetical protein